MEEPLEDEYESAKRRRMNDGKRMNEIKNPELAAQRKASTSRRLEAGMDVNESMAPEVQRFGKKVMDQF